MADLNDAFKNFESTITLTEPRIESLKNSRNSIRKRIKNYITEKHPEEAIPDFYSQGSIVCNTSVNPIPISKNGDSQLIYDIDDGIYFKSKSDEDDRKSVATYHNWIREATDGHTDSSPIDKNVCIRVVFSDGHHIDLPVYYSYLDVPELGHKRDGWIQSDPLAFVDCLNKKCSTNRDLRSIIKITKSWKNNTEVTKGTKLPSGFILSILVANHLSTNSRLDLAYWQTIKSIRDTLGSEFSCHRPTIPTDENLLSSYSNKDFFLEQLDSLLEDGSNALEEQNKKKACLLWQKQFGSRFNCDVYKNITTGNTESSLEPLTKIIGTSAPWL